MAATCSSRPHSTAWELRPAPSDARQFATVAFVRPPAVLVDRWWREATLFGEPLAFGPTLRALFVQLLRLSRRTTPLREPANRQHERVLIDAHAQRVADPDLLGRLCALAVHLDVSAIHIGRGL